MVPNKRGDATQQVALQEWEKTTGAVTASKMHIFWARKSDKTWKESEKRVGGLVKRHLLKIWHQEWTKVEVKKVIFLLFTYVEKIYRRWCLQSGLPVHIHQSFKVYFRSDCDCGERDDVATYTLSEHTLPMEYKARKAK